MSPGFAAFVATTNTCSLLPLTQTRAGAHAASCAIAFGIGRKQPNAVSAANRVRDRILSTSESIQCNRTDNGSTAKGNALSILYRRANMNGHPAKQLIRHEDIKECRLMCPTAHGVIINRRNCLRRIGHRFARCCCGRAPALENQRALEMLRMKLPTRPSQ